MFSPSRHPGQRNVPGIISDRLPEQAAFVDRQPRQTVQNQARGVQTPGQPALLPLKFVSPPTAHLRTDQQKRLYVYCRECKSFITTHSNLSSQLGIPYGTVRGILRRLKQLGLLSVSPYFQGAIQGLHIACGEEGSSFIPHQPSALTLSVTDTPVPNIVPKEIDRSKTDPSIFTIWQTDTQTLRELWPFAAQAGLTPGHFQQLEKVFRIQGRDGEGVVALTLRYLDWQLEHGGITDQKGNQVNDPIAYWLCSMKRSGSYQKPKGYVEKAAMLRQELLAEEDAKLADERHLAALRRERENLAREEELESRITGIAEQGEAHPLWAEVYPYLSRIIQDKVKEEGAVVLGRLPFSILVRGRLREIYGFPPETCPGKTPQSVGR
jgi:hypothetical protein